MTPAPGPSPRRCLALGLGNAIPMLIVIVPFGVLFGVVGTEAGLTVAQIMGFSTFVLAGASQFAAVQMLSDHVPLLLIVLSGLAINLRMAMYSAALVPHLGHASPAARAGVAYALIDQSFALSLEFYERHPYYGIREKLGYFLGCSFCVCPAWLAATLAGATLSPQIPEWMALDFAVPITFLALIAPGLVSMAHIAAAVTSAGLALVLYRMPAGTGLLVAAPIAMAVGAIVEVKTAPSREVK